MSGPGDEVRGADRRTVDVRVGRHLPAALAFRVLAHLDLGRDAANLYDPALPRRAWVPPLLDAYTAAAGRLAIHFVGLYGGTVDDLLARLRGGRVLPLGDATGRHLAAAFAAAIDLEREPFERAFARGAADHAAGAATFEPLLESLARCREALWRRTERTPPPLVVLDCPALGRHGRGMTFRDGSRCVAVSLAQPAEHVFCQVFHEETHPVSDAALAGAATGPVSARDTRADEAGFAAHRRLETAAVTLGATIVAEAAPHLSAAYTRWTSSVWS